MKQHPLSSFLYCPACGSGHFVENDFKSKRCIDCGFICYSNVAASAAAFILNPAGELLLCRRAEQPALGSLDLPGGFVDMGENIEEALKREIFEELSLRVDTMHYLFSLPMCTFTPAWRFTPWIFSFFAALMTLIQFRPTTT
jgi:NADH pyrophosphatase NudC (nudix superfamily)